MVGGARFYFFVAVVLILSPQLSYALENTVSESQGCRVEAYHLYGLKRTEESWFVAYLDLKLPRLLGEADEQEIREHIMTADIFSNAEVHLLRINRELCELNIKVVEKWTTIPVIRGAYGGGTPLLVVGGYETNAMGKLYAVGGEVRKYGTMAPGFFLFAKSPRAWNGRGSVGGELWLDRRRRAFFDDSGKVYGYADSEAWTFKYQILYPLSDRAPGSGVWQAGMHLELVSENATTFTDKDSIPSDVLKPQDLSVPDAIRSSAVVMPMVAFDKLVVDGLDMNGVRSSIRAGGQVAQQKFSSAAEAEIFWYQRLPAKINLAAHGFAGSQGSDSLRNLYFLGGFDSIRGLPDGVHYGKNMVYGNAELRWLGFESKFLHLQSAVFADHGSAFSKREDGYNNRETSIGFGARIAVPQVYRLLVRIDYGWSVGHTKSQGLSIGLGQFFQPYKLFF